jgi:hypothetical protein
MAPQTPLLLYDNVFDTVQQYPTGVVAADDFRTGSEPWRLASYRRERSSWTPTVAAANHWVKVDLGATVTRDPDSLFLDRGHNLWGKTVSLQWSADGVTAFTTLRTFVLPAVGTLSGDPTTVTGAVTEEGAWWAIFAASGTPRRGWRLLVVDNMLPVVTGIIAGVRHQLDGYSRTFDEDAGERTENTATSQAGYRASDTTYSWRTCDLDLAYIGSTVYDAAIRVARDKLFKRAQPVVIAMDYGTRAERAWMYQYDGRAWTFAKKRSYREGRMRFREVGASLSCRCCSARTRRSPRSSR